MKIVTLTLSPAFDVHFHAEKLELGRENFVRVLGRDAGGKGINISRALRAFGVESVAVAVLGEDNCGEFRELLLKEGVSVAPIVIPGRIRENVTVRTLSGEETRMSPSSPDVPFDTLGKIEAITGEVLEPGDVLTLTGSIPRGVPINEIVKYLKRERERGVRVIVDSRSLTLDDIVEIKPFLIKPNEYEIEKYAGRTVKGIEEAVKEAESLRTIGIENVMITLGKGGAVISSAEGSFAVAAPSVEVRSTIGAGDSAIAGFIYALSKGESIKNALASSVAFGSAACLSEGTKPPLRETVIEMLENGIFVE